MTHIVRRFDRYRNILLVIVSLFGLLLVGCTGNVIESYEEEFGLDIPEPATGPWPLWFIFSENCTQDFGYNEELGVEVGTIREGLGHWTTTAYLPTGVVGQRHLYVMHLNLCGTELQETYQGHTKYEKLMTPIPAGTFSVLTVVLTYPETTDANTMAYLTNAQNEINQQHADFASDSGYASPLVQFNFSNETVSGSALSISINTSEEAIVRDLRREHIHVDDYDFLVVVNPDPTIVEGGRAYPGSTAPYYIYMGNFNAWITPLTQADLTLIARSIYHHEIGHYWGWQHGWSCMNEGPFITNPELFGWTDTDEDGVAEIIDSTPYGTSP
jgi:hypothetical protein